MCGQNILSYLNEKLGNMEDSLNRYQEHVLNLILRDTEFDRVLGTTFFIPPFEPAPIPIHSIDKVSDFDQYYLEELTEYCVNTYGITEDECKLIWEKYKDAVRSVIPPPDRYNLSEEYLGWSKAYSRNDYGDNPKNILWKGQTKTPQWEYLNKVVDLLVRETELSDTYTILTHNPSRMGMTYFEVQNWDHSRDFNKKKYSIFESYVRNNYGLSDWEIELVFDKYIDKISDKCNEHYIRMGW